MRQMFFGHLGLGDHLICNGLICHLAQHDQITVLAKHHNVAYCKHMWSDLPNVTVDGVADDKEAELVCESFENCVGPVIRNGTA